MKKIIFPLCLAAALLPGCTTNEKETGAFRPQKGDVYNLEDREPFVLLSAGAQRSVTCSTLAPKILDDGRLQVVANVRNRLQRRIQVQINCVFKDELGVPVEDVPWRNLILDENAQEGVTFVSMNNRAKKYTIRVREAR